MNKVHKFVKKPIEVEAIEFTRDSIDEVDKFTGNTMNICIERRINGKVSANIETPKGVMKVEIGDYIIKGVKGEFYPCKPDIFNLTYEMVDDNE